tara:strand:- start:1726 stop:2373 length:648 start_codon:yes stop_codon:yes gene_type:complete
MDFESFKNLLETTKDMPLVVECRDIPDLSKMCVEVPVKKSVSFSSEVKVTSYTEPRKNNMCPKYDLPHTEEDVMEKLCKDGMYLDDLEDQLEIIENGVFNDGNVVNDTETKKRTSIMKNYEVRRKRKENFMNQRDVISYLTTSILLDGNGIIKDIPMDLLLDCIANMMEIYEHLEAEDSCYTLSYRESVTISNRPGKRQRPIIKRKVLELTNSYL